MDAVITVVAKADKTIGAARDLTVTNGTYATGTGFLAAGTYTTAGTDLDVNNISVTATKDVTLTFELGL